MRDFSWTAAEQKIARQAFDQAVEAELNSLVHEFKARADAAGDPAAIWAIRDWLDLRQREIDSDYDFRYSQLIPVFAALLGKGKLEISQLAGLSEDKMGAIRLISAF